MQQRRVAGTLGVMGKVPRIDVAGCSYHVYNRGNARARLFHSGRDYSAFIRILAAAKEEVGVHLYAYCLMPNHWHLVLEPRVDGDMGRFMHYLTLTHTQRKHAFLGTVGQGHIYQGPYRSNMVENSEHFFVLARYVERNALRAGLVQRVEDWRWSSFWLRQNMKAQAAKLLSDWPVDLPKDYMSFLTEAHTAAELESIRTSLKRGRPYGGGVWQDEMASVHGLESTFRSRGRPAK